MTTLRKALGIIMIVLAAAVLVQVVLAAMSDEWGYEGDVWGITNWFIAAGILIAFGLNIHRALEASSIGEPFERMASTFMLLLTSALGLLFYEQWFSVRLFAPDDFVLLPVRSMSWIAINVLFIGIGGATGWRLQRRIEMDNL